MGGERGSRRDFVCGLISAGSFAEHPRGGLIKAALPFGLSFARRPYQGRPTNWLVIRAAVSARPPYHLEIWLPIV